MKATHRGHCQACDRVQKLPSGRLSSHGYTKQWGFFQGICPGTGHGPFELSTDYIERTIADALRAADKDRTFAETLRATPVTDATCWVHEGTGQYVRREQVYRWRQVKLTVGSYNQAVYVTEDGRTRAVGLPLGGAHANADGLNRAAKQANEVRATALDKSVTRLGDYVAWQRKRIADWTLGAVVEVAA